MQAILFRASPQFCFGWRRWLLRLFGARVGTGALIRPTASVTYPWKLSVGEHAWIGDEVVLYSLGEISIGANAVVSQRCYLCTGSHDFTAVEFPIWAEPIIVGPEAWLATDVFVAPGVTIGRGTVVGARSTVLSDLPEMMLCHGHPARPVRPRLSSTRPLARAAGHA